ncbi:hypothetical protein DFH09DRAFT_1109292 [Mycena vulgaris]|nr:hypothetical protein DFH09DRAFT_1109292 [Mycena vulgaris]
MLLHCNYGAAAVKWWGHGADLHLGISNQPIISRPSVPVPAATGPIRTKRTPAQLDASIQKRATGNMGGSGSGHRDREAAQEGEVMDPDEIVMFFWSRNPAAVERRKREAEDRKREEEERASRMEQWRESVLPVHFTTAPVLPRPLYPHVNPRTALNGPAAANLTAHQNSSRLARHSIRQRRRFPPKPGFAHAARHRWRRQQQTLGAWSCSAKDFSGPSIPTNAMMFIPDSPTLLAKILHHRRARLTLDGRERNVLSALITFRMRPGWAPYILSRNNCLVVQFQADRRRSEREGAGRGAKAEQGRLKLRTVLLPGATLPLFWVTIYRDK